MPDTVKGDAPMPSSFDEDLYVPRTPSFSRLDHLLVCFNEYSGLIILYFREFWDEGRWTKLGRRLKEEPLIPLGLAATCYALYGATKSIRRGDKTQTNRFFRARVYAQAFTLLCLCVGSVYWKEDREKRKHYEGLLGEKRAQEKRDAWIKELEARDEEDKLEREKKKRRREIIAQRKKQEAIEQQESDENKEQANVRSSMVDDMELRSIATGDSTLLKTAMSLWRRWHSDQREDGECD